jgi:hypothetical protein
MAKNRLFFPQQVLDAWVAAAKAELRDTELFVRDESRSYRLAEGVRVLREVSGEPDAQELVGKCKTLAYLRELGADILDTSMILESNAYDIVPGFLGTPVGSSPAVESVKRPALSSDEELLAEFLAKKM